MIHAKIDLNLFIVLHAVYEQGSITQAASTLHITQPAVSHAISRLRNKFNDPLFIRHGRKMVPSELCQRIMPDIQASLAQLNGTLMPSSRFDITQHDRVFKLGYGYLRVYFFPPLMTDIVSNTPNFVSILNKWLILT